MMEKRRRGGVAKRIIAEKRDGEIFERLSVDGCGEQIPITSVVSHVRVFWTIDFTSGKHGSNEWNTSASRTDE